MKNVTSANKRSFGAVFTSMLLVIVMIAVMLITTACSGSKDDGFDYLNADLSQYIEFTESYKDFSVNIDIAKPTDIDVEVAILNMLYGDRETDPRYNGNPVISPIEITSGDVVNIWYRGYLITDDGEKVAVDGMSNFTGTAPYSLAIGSNNFIPGFELNLIGKNTGDFPKFEKITTGTAQDNQIAYVSYTRMEGNDTTTKVTVANERIDLSGDVDAKYGDGFKAALKKIIIGTKVDVTAKLNGKDYTYKDCTVNFVTECETNPITIEAYFPYDYNKTELRNETAYFEVYVDSIIVYDCPEFTPEYLEKKINDKDINVTLEELSKFEGKDITEQYRAFAMKTMMDIYEEEYDSLVEEQVWLHLEKISKAKQYPADKVDEIYQEYLADIDEQFISSGGKVYNNTTGSYQTYTTLDAYANAQFKVAEGQTWRDQVYSEAQNFIKERLTIYYILKAENLVPGEAEFKVEYDKIVQEYIDQAIEQFMYYDGNKTKDDYTEKEYQSIVDECTEMVHDNFSDEVFTIRAYYNIVSAAAIKWPTVKTLDERRAYPQDK